MAFGKRTLRINTMYGADGRLRTSYLEGKAAMAAKKNVKAFNRELARYEKDFTNYASLDINAANISNTNTRFIFGKLNIAEKYIDYIPAGDMAESIGDDMTAVAGNRSAYRLGIGSKIAGVFQPFLEKQAKKHPSLQALSDNITKAANGGRMPLTADSAAIMKIAFDKKYYYDCRRPGADRDALKEQYDSAMSNLMTMAAADGVNDKALSAKISEKLITQMQIDESLTDIYAGMSTGEIRLGEDKPMLNAKGEEIKIKGKTLYQRANNFVDPNGNEISGLNLTPREPQTIDEILEDYQTKLDKYAKSCKTEADFKKMLASDSYQNIERNAKVFAALDCPDEAEKFKYEFARVNIESCRNWALENDNKSPYAQLVVPPKFDEVTAGNNFVRGYATSDYYNIDGIEDDYYTTRDISERAQEDIQHMSDDELADSLKSDVTDSHAKLSDIEKLQKRLDELEAENRALREQLYLDETSVEKEKADETVHTTDNDKSDYSLFKIEHMGEVAYFRDKGVDIDAFVKRFADIEAKMPGKYYEFLKDSEKMNGTDFAALEQSRKNPPAFSADINLDEREFVVCKGNQFAMTGLDEIIENVNNAGKTNLSFQTFDYEEISESETPSDDMSFDEALMNGEEIEVIEPETASENKTLAIMYYNKYESGDQSWHDTGTLTVNNGVFTLNTHNGYTGKDEDSVITRQEAEIILNKAAAKEDDHFLTDDGREFYKNERIAEKQSESEREAADTSAVDIPNEASVEILSSDEKDNKTDTQSESPKNASVGYIGIGRSGRDAFNAFKQHINEQFGSSGNTILPSSFGKRNYTVKSVEIPSEVDTDKYAIEDKHNVPEKSVESTFEQGVETNVETKSVTETNVEAGAQSFIDTEFEEVEDNVDIKEVFNDTSSDNKSAAATSKFSDGDFADFDDYEEDFDDEDFSP